MEEKDSRKIDFTKFTFLAKPQDGLMVRLGRELHFSEISSGRLSFRSLILFDRLYGQNLHFEYFETVILVAKGIGIASILPYIQYLTQRSFCDSEIKKSLKLVSTANKNNLRKGLYRDITRKVDIF
jgi:hypothetical protein